MIWGTTYLGIRISLETIPPVLMGGLRWMIAGALLARLHVARGERLPPPSSGDGIALLGFLMLGLGNGGVVFAEQWVPSGLAAVIVATSPFWMAGVEAFLPDGERLTRARSFWAGGRLQRDICCWSGRTCRCGPPSSRGFLAGVIALQVASSAGRLGSAYVEAARRGSADR